MIPMLFLVRRPGHAAPTYFEKDLIAYLNSLGLVAYPGHIPQRAALPAISFFKLSASRARRIKGATGLATRRYQVTVSSRSADDVFAIGARLVKNLDRVRYSIGSTYVYVGRLEGQLTHYEPPPDASDRGVHAEIHTYEFSYREN